MAVAAVKLSAVWNPAALGHKKVPSVERWPSVEVGRQFI